MGNINENDILTLLKFFKMTTAKVNNGDTFKHKGDNDNDYIFVVIHVINDSEVTCEYFDKNGVRHQQDFKLSSLIKIENN